MLLILSLESTFSIKLYAYMIHQTEIFFCCKEPSGTAQVAQIAPASFAYAIYNVWIYNIIIPYDVRCLNLSSWKKALRKL